MAGYDNFALQEIVTGLKHWRTRLEKTCPDHSHLIELNKWIIVGQAGLDLAKESEEKHD